VTVYKHTLICTMSGLTIGGKERGAVHGLQFFSIGNFVLFIYLEVY